MYLSTWLSQISHSRNLCFMRGQLCVIYTCPKLCLAYMCSMTLLNDCHLMKIHTSVSHLHFHDSREKKNLLKYWFQKSKEYVSTNGKKKLVTSQYLNHYHLEIHCHNRFLFSYLKTLNRTIHTYGLALSLDYNVLRGETMFTGVFPGSILLP